jgi:hypothetical protein
MPLCPFFLTWPYTLASSDVARRKGDGELGVARPGGVHILAFGGFCNIPLDLLDGPRPAVVCRAFDKVPS